MTEADRKIKKYTNSVKRKLNLPSNVKARVMSDFVSAIRSRREAGKTDEEIFAEFGAPSDVAAGLNEQMKEFAYIKSPWRWLCLTLAVICFAALLFRGGAGLAAFLMTGLLFDGNAGVIGSADGPTAILLNHDTGKLHTVCSSLHFEPVEEVEWRAVFCEKMMEDISVELL